MAIIFPFWEKIRVRVHPVRQQVIVDGFTNLKSLCGESAIAFFKMSLTDTRKAKEYLLGITHNAMPGLNQIKNKIHITDIFPVLGIN